MLDNRKKKILQAIVEEYIETAEPVSSKSIVEKHGIDYSSATIRNDMAELEKIGLLDKPHTSCLLYTSPSPRDLSTSRMPSSA